MDDFTFWKLQIYPHNYMSFVLHLFAYIFCFLKM